MITAYHHAGFAAPIGEAHLMPMRKFAMVADAVRQLPGIVMREPAPLDPSDLLRVHSAEYVDAIRTGDPRALAESQKFPWSAQLFPSVLLTNGGVVAAAEHALDDGIAACVASGFHHACADHGEGFCTFNGLVIAGELLRSRRRLQRLAVLDLDLHYGNGTASLAEARPWLFAVSIYGNDYRDNTPYRDVAVRRHADGPNHISTALPNGSGRCSLLDALEDAFVRIRGFRPDLLLYQAGADPYREDPYSPLDLGHEDLLERDRAVFQFARDARIPVAWVLAGGYTPDTSKVVAVHVNTFHAALAVHGS
jgi:acetoin utilization deacetylase AcuC-like enzyme